MIFRKLIFGWISILLTGGTLCATELLLTSDAAVQKALGNNPDILAARATVAEAEIRTRGVGRLANPEIETEIASGRDFEGRAEIGVSQSLPVTPRLRLERERAALEVEIAQLNLRELERRLILATRIAYYEFAAASEAMALAVEQSVHAKKFAETLQANSAEGMGSGLDADSAGLEAEVLGHEAEALRAAVLGAAGELATLLGVGADTVLVAKETLVLPTENPAHRPLGLRPDLRLAEMAVMAGAVDVSLAKASRWEDVTVGLFVEGERFRETSGMESEFLGGLRFSIPLPVWQNGNTRVESEQASQERRQLQLEALQFTARSQAVSAHRVMSALYVSASQAESKLVAAARGHAANTAAAYERGEIEMEALFRARERLARIEASALQSRKTFHLARADWLHAVGLPIHP